MRKDTPLYPSNYITIKDTQVHYIDKGNGQPMLFLHGNPTSSYLWRNVIPRLENSFRCIAPDLPGMGKSGKPYPNFRFITHYSYIEAFINKLGLNNIVLILHDWGSAIGFHYSMKYPDNIKGIVFMESLVKTWKKKELKLHHRIGFQLLRTPLIGEILIYGFNAFLNIIFPSLIRKKLTQEEMKEYKKPFNKTRDRKPMLVWPREIPIDGKPADVTAMVNNYSEFIQKAGFPKLMIYANPGAIINQQVKDWCDENISNLSTYYLGKGYHFIQEDYPEKIGDLINEWYNETF
jgi:haloalkane dehalogenase